MEAGPVVREPNATSDEQAKITDRDGSAMKDRRSKSRCSSDTTDCYLRQEDFELSRRHLALERPSGAIPHQEDRITYDRHPIDAPNCVRGDVRSARDLG